MCLTVPTEWEVHLRCCARLSFFIVIYIPLYDCHNLSILLWMDVSVIFQFLAIMTIAVGDISLLSLGYTPRSDQMVGTCF